MWQLAVRFVSILLLSKGKEAPPLDTKRSERRPAAAHAAAELSTLSDAYARLARKFEVQEKLLHLFTDLDHPDRVCRGILDAALHAVPTEASSLLRRDPRSGRLTFLDATGPVADRVRGVTLPCGEGLAGASAEDGRAIAVSDVSRDPRHAREFSESLGFAARSLLAVPLLNHGEVLGVIEMVNRRGGDVFARHEIEAVERVARAAGNLLRLMPAPKTPAKKAPRPAGRRR